MAFGIQDELTQFNLMGALKILLADKTTGANIIWATDTYEEKGELFCRNREITPELVTFFHGDLIKNRTEKELSRQSERTRKRAEVFTPLWICKKMIDYIDDDFYGNTVGSPQAAALSRDPSTTLRSAQDDGAVWQAYVQNRRLEITCGEAPYLVSRYDVSTGERIPIENRIGILDRKLRLISQNVSTQTEWLNWVVKAYQATYGYEFQGDSLLIARVNLLATFVEYYEQKWNKPPDKTQVRKIANIIAWNIWQMDGLNCRVPYCKAGTYQLSFYEMAGLESYDEKQPLCRIKNWNNQYNVYFNNLSEGKGQMKFDYIIGNPPYQDETLGENVTFAPPIYHKFIDNCYPIATVVELIHPARFLFNAGSTPKDWNRKMLNDKHYKVLDYWADCAAVFPNVDIKGGIAITFKNEKEDYGEIGTFTAFMELNSISKKVYNRADFKSIMPIVLTRTSYRLTDLMHSEHPEAMAQLSNGHPYDMSTNIFDRLPQIFFNEKPNDGEDYIQIYGRENNIRVFKYIKRKYVNNVKNLDYYKIFVPKSNGSGAIGEVLSTPVIGQPVIGHTESFISIGKFDSEAEATACLKYIMTKFARVLLGILKVTQDNPPDKWKYVPLQDFTENSDIDWSKSVAEIDRQLYAKYGLDEREISFIETNVKEMN